MEEIQQTKEIKKEKLPEAQDIVSINGRWGQVFSASDDIDHPVLIKWLDTMEPEDLDLRKYTLEHKFMPATVVKNIQDQFSDKEKENIYWGSEQKKHPFLKLQVTVFGKYITKS
ncbi:MAG: hypothetical protein Q7K54_04835 [Candidatus Parcubacteria bacterium]|nr:hypothetical protein [Candidatus Parcubacteria bacterium]